MGDKLDFYDAPSRQHFRFAKEIVEVVLARKAVCSEVADK
jgi:hypothetical protein